MKKVDEDQPQMLAESGISKGKLSNKLIEGEMKIPRANVIIKII